MDTELIKQYYIKRPSINTSAQMDYGHLSGKGTQVRASVTFRLKRAPAAGLEGEIMHIAFVVN